MNAKQEWMECSSLLRAISEAPAVWIEPPWLNSEGASLSVHPWREVSFEVTLDNNGRGAAVPAATRPLAVPAGGPSAGTAKGLRQAGRLPRCH